MINSRTFHTYFCTKMF